MDDPTGEDDLTALEQLLDVLRSDALHELYLLDGYTNVHATLDGSALRADLARLIAAAPAWARPRDEDEW